MNKKTILVDVRTREEYDEHYVNGAINVPVEEMGDGKLGILETVEKSTPIQLYCRSGARSEKARQILISLGCTDVTNLGGINDVESFFGDKNI